MRTATTNPEAAVSAATTQTAVGMPNAPASSPAATAPLAARTAASGTSALFAMTSDAVTDKVWDAFRGQHVELVSTNLSAEQERTLVDVFAESGQNLTGQWRSV